MISYQPFWLKARNITTYYLTETLKISSSTINRLRHDKNISTYTINRLCALIGCSVPEILEYIPDAE